MPEEIVLLTGEVEGPHFRERLEEPASDWDYVARDLEDLADQLGC